MKQDRLFRLAVEAISLNAHRESDGYWSATIRVRRGDEAWDEARVDSYDHLSTPELDDVLVATLRDALGL